MWAVGLSALAELLERPLTAWNEGPSGSSLQSSAGQPDPPSCAAGGGSPQSGGEPASQLLHGRSWLLNLIAFAYGLTYSLAVCDSMLFASLPPHA